MTPEELHEQVKRRIALAFGVDPDRTGVDLSKFDCAAGFALDLVREAMREPSDDMLFAGCADHDTPSTPIYTSEAIIIWRAMLAASPLREE